VVVDDGFEGACAAGDVDGRAIRDVLTGLELRVLLVREREVGRPPHFADRARLVASDEDGDLEVRQVASTDLGEAYAVGIDGDLNGEPARSLR
jgi:hypothetical protein